MHVATVDTWMLAMVLSKGYVPQVSILPSFFDIEKRILSILKRMRSIFLQKPSVQESLIQHWLNSEVKEKLPIPSGIGSFGAASQI